MAARTLLEASCLGFSSGEVEGSKEVWNIQTSRGRRRRGEEEEEEDEGEVEVYSWLTSKGGGGGGQEEEERSIQGLTP
jgi:hypothetical protein